VAVAALAEVAFRPFIQSFQRGTSFTLSVLYKFKSLDKSEVCTYSKMIRFVFKQFFNATFFRSLDSNFC